MGEDSFTPGLAEQLAGTWGREPRVFRQALSSPAFTPREFMECIVGAAADYVADSNSRYGRVFVSGEIVKPEQVPHFLPVDASEDVGLYVKKLSTLHSDFSFI